MKHMRCSVARAWFTASSDTGRDTRSGAIMYGNTTRSRTGSRGRTSGISCATPGFLPSSSNVIVPTLSEPGGACALLPVRALRCLGEPTVAARPSLHPELDRTVGPMIAGFNEVFRGRILASGRDGSTGGTGTWFEGAITSGLPTDAIDDAVQANVVTAGYGK